MRTAVAVLLAACLGIGALPPRILAQAPEKGNPQEGTGERSSKIAFLMSLVVPGLGEFYYGAHKRGMAFMAVEAGSWATYATWYRKGRSVERDFRAYADQHWSQARYQSWDAGTPPSFYMRTESLPSRSADTQQYYELIGKYDQFVFGWDDARDASGKLVGTDYGIHPSKVISANRVGYEVERNRSNRYYKRASRLLGLVVVNHLASAVDASILARDRKARLWVEADAIGDRLSDPAPALRLLVRF